MERLVMIINIGDGFTFSADRTLPVLYESAEALYCDLEKEIEVAFDKLKNEHRPWAQRFEFTIAGYEFNVDDFLEKGTDRTEVMMPEILTLDEWYEKGA